MLMLLRVQADAAAASFALARHALLCEAQAGAHLIGRKELVPAPLCILLAEEIMQGYIDCLWVCTVLQSIGEGQAHGLDPGVQVVRTAPLLPAQLRIALQDVQGHQRSHALFTAPAQSGMPGS